MSLITGSYPSFTNGVSQQSPAIRLPSQGELQDNGYSSPVDGLMKRPPTEWIKRFNYSTAPVSPLVHFINRDEQEKYVVVVESDGTVRVFSLLDGTEYAVTNSSQSYLASATPSRQIRPLTLADTTFLLNTTKTVTMKSDQTAGSTSDAVVWVRAGNYSTTYTINVNGTAYTFTTPNGQTAGDEDRIATDYIAQHIKNGSTTIPASGFKGSMIRIQGVTSISVSDSYGDRNMSVVFQRVAKFTDLPPTAVNGMVVTVTGDATQQQDDYYVQFQASNAGEAFGPGVWVECPKPGITYKLDETTMPRVLVRNNTVPVTFTVQTAPWGNRVVGDTDTSPDPSFVGHQIHDVFLFKNRLGFLSNENIVMSRSGDFYEFFRSTVLQIQDDDPIDVSAAHPRVITLYNAVPFQQALLLFGDQTQMILAGNELLSPKTVNITVATEYESEPYCRPVQSGSDVYFAFNNETYTGVREYFVDANTGTKDATTITDHVPRYIKGRATRIAVSTTENVMVLQPDTDRQYVYVYKWLWNGQQKVQSSWSQWSFGAADTTVLGFDFVGPTLYLLIKRPDGVSLERMSLAPGRVDDFTDYTTHLDRRITQAQCTSVSYDTNRNVTTFTLPYNKYGAMDVVTRANASPAWKPGVVKGLDQRSTTSRFAFQVEESGSLVVGTRDYNLTVEGPLAVHGTQLTVTKTGYVTVSFDSKNPGSTENGEFWVFINGNRVEFETVTVADTPNNLYPDFLDFTGWGFGYHPTLSELTNDGSGNFTATDGSNSVSITKVSDQWNLTLSNGTSTVTYTSPTPTGTYSEVSSTGTHSGTPPTEVYPDLTGFGAGWTSTATGQHISVSQHTLTDPDTNDSWDNPFDDDGYYEENTAVIYPPGSDPSQPGKWIMTVSSEGMLWSVNYSSPTREGTYTFYRDNLYEDEGHTMNSDQYPTTVTVTSNGSPAGALAHPNTIDVAGSGGGPSVTRTVSPLTIAYHGTETFQVQKDDRVQLYVHNLTDDTHSGFHDVGARTAITDLTAADATSNTIKVSGNLVGQDVWIGSNYEFRYRLTQPVVRIPSQLGGIESLTGARLQVRTLSLDYSNTGYFRVEVTPKGRDVSKHAFTGKVMGSSDTEIGQSQTLTGSKRCFVGAKNDQVTIDVVNDTFRPCRFTGGAWEGLFTSRARRM